jgi:hypothetical protein
MLNAAQQEAVASLDRVLSEPRVAAHVRQPVASAAMERDPLDHIVCRAPAPR